MVENHIGYGAIVSGAQPADGKVDINRDTRTLLEGMARLNMQVTGHRQPPSADRRLVTRVHIGLPVRR